MRTRMMYIECKTGEDAGSARIGRVTFSKSGRSVHYNGKTFGLGNVIHGNYFDKETGDEYWTSGCKKRGGDRLYEKARYLLMKM